MSVIPVAVIPADPAEKVGPTRFVVSCDQCGIWSSPVSNERRARAVARNQGWGREQRPPVVFDVCPRCGCGEGSSPGASPAIPSSG